MPAPEGLCTLLRGALEQLAGAQRAAGPVRSVVGGPLVLTVTKGVDAVTPRVARAAPEAEETGAGAGVGETGAGVEAADEPEPAWPEPKGAGRPALREVARRTAAMLEARLAQEGEALALETLGVDALLEVAGSAAGGEGRLRVPQPVAEEWVRMRCTLMWIEEARVAALSAEEREAEVPSPKP